MVWTPKTRSGTHPPRSLPSSRGQCHVRPGDQPAASVSLLRVLHGSGEHGSESLQARDFRHKPANGVPLHGPRIALDDDPQDSLLYQLIETHFDTFEHVCAFPGLPLHGSAEIRYPSLDLSDGRRGMARRRRSSPSPPPSHVPPPITHARCDRTRSQSSECGRNGQCYPKRE